MIIDFSIQWFHKVKFVNFISERIVDSKFGRGLV